MQEKISNKRKRDIKMSFQCVLVSWCILNFAYAFWDQKSLMCTSVFYLSNLSQLLHPWALSACFVNDQKKILFGTKATAAIYLVVISAEPHSAELCQDLIRVLIHANSLQCLQSGIVKNAQVHCVLIWSIPTRSVVKMPTETPKMSGKQ